MSIGVTETIFEYAVYSLSLSENLALTHLFPVPAGYGIGFEDPLIFS